MLNIDKETLFFLSIIINKIVTLNCKNLNKIKVLNSFLDLIDFKKDNFIELINNNSSKLNINLQIL